MSRRPRTGSVERSGSGAAVQEKPNIASPLGAVPPPWAKPAGRREIAGLAQGRPLAFVSLGSVPTVPGWIDIVMAPRALVVAV